MSRDRDLPARRRGRSRPLGDLLRWITLTLLLHDLTGSGLAVAALIDRALGPGGRAGAARRAARRPVRGVRRADRRRRSRRRRSPRRWRSRSTGRRDPRARGAARRRRRGRPAGRVRARAGDRRASDARRRQRAEWRPRATRASRPGPLLGGVARGRRRHRGRRCSSNAATFVVVALAARPAAGAPPAAAAQDGRARAGPRRRRATCCATAARRSSWRRPRRAPVHLRLVDRRGLLLQGRPARSADAGYALLFSRGWSAWSPGRSSSRAASPHGRAGRRARSWPSACRARASACQTVWLAVGFGAAMWFLGGVGHGAKNALVRTLIQERVPGPPPRPRLRRLQRPRNGAELVALGAGGVLVVAIGARGDARARGRDPRGRRARRRARLPGQHPRRRSSAGVTAFGSVTSPLTHSSRRASLSADSPRALEPGRGVASARGSIRSETSRSRSNCSVSSPANASEVTHSVASSLSWNERLSKFADPTADQHAVDGHRLRVQHRRLVLVDLDAGVDQLVVGGAARDPDRRLVDVRARHEHAHAHAALGARPASASMNAGRGTK